MELGGGGQGTFRSGKRGTEKAFSRKKGRRVFKKIAIFVMEDDIKTCVADRKSDGDEPISKPRKKRHGEEEVGVESRR